MPALRSPTSADPHVQTSEDSQRDVAGAAVTLGWSSADTDAPLAACSSSKFWRPPAAASHKAARPAPGAPGVEPAWLAPAHAAAAPLAGPHICWQGGWPFVGAIPPLAPAPALPGRTPAGAAAPQQVQHGWCAAASLPQAATMGAHCGPTFRSCMLISVHPTAPQQAAGDARPNMCFPA